MNLLSTIQYPALAQYADNLTQQIAEGKLIPTLNDENQPDVHRMLQVLGRRSKNDPILVGEDSVRKVAVVHEAARRILIGDLPDKVNICIEQIWTFRHDLFFADTEDNDILRDRMVALVNDLKGSNGQVALYVDDLHQVIGTLNERTLFVGEPFRVAHARGEITFIGSTTLENYRFYLENNFFSNFARRSQCISIE